jgi:hypothetical protein
MALFLAVLGFAGSANAQAVHQAAATAVRIGTEHAASTMPSFSTVPASLPGGGWTVPVAPNPRVAPASFTYANVPAAAPHTNQLQIGISSAQAQPADSLFGIYQGYQYSVSTNVVVADLFVPSSWQTTAGGPVATYMWAIGSSGDSSVIGFRNYSTGAGTFTVWNDNNGSFTDLPGVPVNYNGWNNLSVYYAGANTVIYSINGVQANTTTLSTSSASISAVFMNSVNFFMPDDTGPGIAAPYTSTWSDTSAPTILTTNLPTQPPSQFFSQTLVANEGAPPYAWSFGEDGVLAGSGLVLSAAGVLSSAGPVAGNYAIPLRVTDAQGNTATQSISWVVADPLTPAVTSVTPNTVPVNSAATSVTIAGSNFGNGSTVLFTPPGGTATTIMPSLVQLGQFRVLNSHVVGTATTSTSSLVQAAQLAATIPASLLSSAGTAQIAISNGGSTLSNQIPFTISPVAASGPVCSTLTLNQFLSAVHAEGTTEQLTDITLSGCVGLTNTAAITVSVLLNVPIGNAGITGSENGSLDAVAVLSGWTLAGDQATAQTIGGTAAPGSTIVSFTFHPVVGSAPGTITFRNLRIDASTLPSGSVVVATAFSGSGLLITAPPASVAVTQTSLTSPQFTGYGNIAICSTNATDVNAVGTVRISDAFLGAFSTDSEEYAKETASGASSLANNPITAATTVGTRLAVTFSNLVNGASYYLPASVTNGGLSLALVPSASSPASAALTGGTIGGVGNAGNTGSGATVSGVHQFSPLNGSFTAWYAVTADSAIALDQTAAFSATVPIGGATPFNSITLFETIPNKILSVPGTPPTVSISLAGNSSGYARFSAPLSPAVVSATAGTVSACTPAVTSVVPNTVPVNSAATPVTIAGSNFTNDSIILFTPPGGAATAIVPSLVQSAQIAATIPATLLSSAGTAQIAISNGGSTLSNLVSFAIAPGPPPLSITSAQNLGTFTTGTQQIPLQAIGGNGAYVWSVTAGTLPPGLALRTDTPSGFTANQQAGLIGVATLPGNYSFTLSVTSGGQTVSQPNTSIRITSLNLKENAILIPDAFIGAAYSYQFTALNVAGSVTFTPTSGVPPGMTLSAGGLLSGTPTTPGQFTLNVSISDSVDTVYAYQTVSVFAVNITSPAILPNASPGAAYSTIVTASGGTPPYMFTASCCLPAGLMLSSDGHILGTITADPGDYVFPVNVRDSNENSYEKRLVIDNVGSPPTPSRLSIYGSFFGDAVAGDAGAWGVSVCCGGTAPYTWTATGLPPGTSLHSLFGAGTVPIDVEVWGIPQTSGTYNIQFTVTDATGASTSQTFPLHVSALDADSLPDGTINVPYSYTLRALGGTGPYTAKLLPGGQLPAGITFNAAQLQFSGTPLEAGSFPLNIEFADSADPKNTLLWSGYLTIAGNGASTVAISSGSALGTFNVGTAPSNTLLACCASSFNWSVVGGSLPPGQSLSSSGQLSGTLTTPGTYSFLVRAVDGNNSANVDFRQFTETITPISITTGSLPYGNIGTTYNQTLTASGGTGALSWMLSSYSYLPPGLVLTPDGVISGTPSFTGQFLFNVTVSDTAGNTNTNSFTINTYLVGSEHPAAQTIAFGALNDVVFGAGSFSLSATATSGLQVAFSTTSTACGVSGTTVTVIAVGVCAIAADQAGGATYSAAPTVTRSFNVTKAAQTITFTKPGDVAFGSGNLTLTATSGSGLAVTFSTISTACSVTGATVTLNAVGTCAITADQAGSSSYSAAPTVTQSFNITKVTQTITFTKPGDVVFGSGNVTVSATATSNLTVTFSTTSTACSVTGTSVTLNAAGPCAITADQSGGATYSAAPTVTQTFNITKASQTIAFSKPGDVVFASGNVTLSATSTSTSTLPVTFSSTSAACSVSGTTVTLTGAGACSIAADQAGSVNYSPAPTVMQTFNIIKASQTITFTKPGDVVFGSGNVSLSAPATSTLPVTFSTTSAACSVSGTMVTLNGVGQCAIAADQAGSANYSAAPTVTQTFNIGKAAQTITFGTLPNVVFGSGAISLSAAASSTLAVAFSTTSTACSISGTALTLNGVGQCAIAADQAGSANHSAAPTVTQTFNITKAAQTITFGTLPNVAFGSGAISLSASASSTLAVTFSTTSTACSVSGAALTLNGAGQCVIAADQAGSANYSAAPTVTQTFNITKAAETITFTKPGDVAFGSGSFALTATATSGLAVTFSTTSTSCSVTGITVTINGVGPCAIAADQPGGANYLAAPTVTQTFNVTKASQTITFGTLSNVVFGSGTITLSATATSTLPVTFSTASTACGVSGTTVAINGAGACAIAADQSGSANYFAAPTVTQTFNVTKASQTVTFGPLSSVAFGSGTITLSATATSTLPVTFSTTSTACSVFGATVTIAGGGPCAIAADQTGSVNYSAAPTVTQTFNVTKASQTISFGNLSNVVFGSGTITLSATATSTLPVTFSTTSTACSVSATTVTITGGGACAIAADQPGSANYSVAPTVTRTFNITQASQSISFGGLRNVTLPVSPFTVAATASSNLPVIFFTSSTACSVSGATVTVNAPGSCAVTASQAGNASFAAAPNVTQTVTIFGAVTVTTTSLPAAAQSAPYSQTLTATGGAGSYQWTVSAGALPAGLSLSTGGTLSGTPTVSGSFALTVTATDGSSSPGSGPITLLVNPALVITTSASLPDAVQGASYSQTLSASGGAGSYTWTLTGGALPAAISLSGAGVLAGKPTASGSSSFTATVTDASGNKTSQSFSLRVDAGLTITTTTLPAAIQGAPYSQALNAVGGLGFPTFSVSAGSLPAGLTLTSNGVLSGTPGAPGSTSFTIQVKDPSGAVATQALSLQVNAALVITTSSLTVAVQNGLYNQTLAATGGSGNLSWSIAAGALPAGITISSAGGLSGTPTVTGPFSFTALVTDQGGSHAQAALSLQVNAALSITTTTLPNAISGTSYSQTLAATGGSGTYSWTVTAGALPVSVALSQSGVLSGTSNAAGSFPFTVQLADQASNTKTQALTLQVNAVVSITSSATLPNGITGKAYSVTLAATGGTGGHYTWSVISGTLPSGVALSPAGALTGNPSVAGAFSFTVQAADGVSAPAQLSVAGTIYAALSITTAFLPNGTSGQPYGPVSLAATGGSGVVTWSVSGLPSNVSASSDGTISGTPAAAGNSTVGLTATDSTSGQTAQASLALTIVAPASPLTVSPSSLVIGSGVGGSVSGAFTATGGTPPLTWSVSNGALPSGVSLNTSTGAVSGAVSQAGNTTVTVSVTDSKSTANAQLIVNVLGLTNSTLPAGAATVLYSTPLAATGGTPPYVFSATGLPSGLSMGGSGVLSGTIASPGTFTFGVQVNDSQGLTASAGYSLTIRTAPVSVKTPTLTDGTVGTPYSQVLSATGGNPPYTWSTVSGALPAGLSLASSGTISGNPPVPGTSSFSVQATDSTGGVASALATIVIHPTPMVITSTALPSGVVGFDFPQQILGSTGGVAPYVYSISGGGLPGGISLAGGVISGTPTAAGDFPITITSKDSSGLSATASLTLTIRPSTSDLLLLAGNLSFSLRSGTTTLLAAQSVGVQSTVASQAVSYTFAVTPASPWLNVTGGTQTPNNLSVSLTSQALTLGPGSYSATVIFTCTSASCNGKTQSVAVSLNVSAPPPQLGVTSALLSFSSNSTPPQPQSQPLGIQNTGGGVIAVSSIACEASWCTVSGVPSAVSAGSATQVTVTVDPSQLVPGLYRTAVDVSTSAGNASVPVNFFISQTVSMSLSPSGSQFGMQQGSAPGNPAGSFLVNLSGSAVSWTASEVAGAGWLTLNTSSGTASGTQPGNVSFSINSSAATLTPQAYYATIRVSAAGVVNSPQDYQVVLNVVTPTTSVQPDPQPAGLLFVAAGAAPAAQLVSVYSNSPTPASYQVSANTTAGGNWLSVTPALGSTSSASPGQSTVTVNTAGLATGVYTGGISYSSTGAAVRTVNVTLVIAGSAPAASARTTISSAAPISTEAGSCSASSLVAAPTGLVANFSAPTSWPTPLAVYLVNNCGAYVTDGQVTATFSNGDPPLSLPLVNAATGLYSATWTPRKSAGQITIIARATSPSGLAPATTQIAGSVVPNAAPVVNPQAAVHAFNPQVGGPLAPGTIIAVYGSNLASQTGQPTSIPLATALNGTSVIIGGIQAPLFYVSPGQINVQVPFELDSSKQYQLVVSANGAIATPQTIQLSPATPGIAAFSDGTLLAQHQDGTLVLPVSPALPGEYIVMYLLGMGGTDNPVTSGNGSPFDPLARPNVTPVVTLGGTQIPVAFAGLTPGLVGLYQINIQVPQNIAGGNQVLTVSQGGNVSNTTILPIQQQ